MIPVTEVSNCFLCRETGRVAQATIAIVILDGAEREYPSFEMDGNGKVLYLCDRHANKVITGSARRIAA